MHNSKVYDGSAELLTTSEVARLLNVSLTTVRNLVSDGVLPSIKIGKNRRFIGGVLYDWIFDSHVDQTIPAFSSKEESDDDAA